MRRAGRALVLAMALLLGASLRVLAQSPAERSMLAGWDDSLTHLLTTATLPQFDALSKAGPDGPAGDLRRSLFQAQGSLLRNNRGALELALSNLNWTSLSRKQWPWPEYALAKIFMEMEQARLRLLASGGQKDGESHVEAGWRHLQAAFRDDPEFDPARALAVQILVAEGDRELRDNERSVLDFLLRRENPEADALLVWGRLLRFEHKYDSAVVVLRRAQLAGSDPSRIALERARTLRALGEAHNARDAYWDGVNHLTPVGREAYRYDLAWIMDPDSLPLFDAVPMDSVPAWLHRFWDERDAAAVNRPGERLEEHLRRWIFAMDHFRVAIPWRRTMFTRVEYGFEGLDACVPNDSALYRLLAREQPTYAGDIRSREPLLDHRGLIYLRHGAPFRSVAGPTHALEVDLENPIAIDAPPPPPAGSGAALPPTPDEDIWDSFCIKTEVNVIGPNDSWLYWFDGTWRLINFRGSCAFGKQAPTTLTSYLPVTAGSSLGVWLARAQLLPEYRDAAQRLQLHLMGRKVMPVSCELEILTAIKKSRTDADVATTTDTDTPPIIRPWDNVVQMFALGHGREGNGKVLVTFALSRASMTADTSGGQVTYPISFRVVAFDHATGETVRVDTVRRFSSARALSRGESISALFELPLGPGTWQVAVRANQGDDSSGVYALKRNVVVDGGAALGLSDIVMGRDDAPSWKATDGAPFPVNVLGAYKAGSTAQLYYEVHGLRAGEAYRSTVVVRAQNAGAKDGIRILSTDRASGPMTHVRKSLGLKQLKPGSYLLIVTIEANGRIATREQPLLIAKP